MGPIANTIGDNVDVSNNSGVVVPADESAGEGTFPAGSTAVAGAANLVGGQKIGECAGP